MPTPSAKSKPRKKTAAKKNASRAIKLQRGGSFTGPANPNVNTPPDWGWQAQRGAQQRAYDAYMRRHPKDGPFAGQMPASMTNRNPQMERDRLAAFQAQQQRAYQGRLGTGINVGGGPGGRPTTPPRRPPPSIRPGYQGGGELVDPNPFPFPGRILLPPGGWGQRRPNVPLPPGTRRRRGRGRGGRDV